MLNIYLTALAAYNNGCLIGKWITLPLDEQELNEELQQILIDGSKACGYGETHEEYFITDYEWENVDLFEIDEYENLNELNSKLNLLESLDLMELKALAFILNEGITLDIEDAILRVADVIIHENMSMEDVAYELMQECYNADTLPSIIANHIDYEAIGRDLGLDGKYTVIGRDVYEYIG